MTLFDLYSGSWDGMAQSTDASDFLLRVESGEPLDAALAPSLELETSLRRLFASDRTNPKLEDPYVGLVDVFGDGTDSIRLTRARTPDSEAEYVRPLKPKERRSRATVDSFDAFRAQWDVFTNNALAPIKDWSNIVVAGGSVMACLMPLPDDVKSDTKAVEKYYRRYAYPTSDVDMFLWGLSAEEAEHKAMSIYDALSSAAGPNCVCVRTKNAISIHTQFPTRPLQIVIRLYLSPSEILTGFDLDAPCVAYDGDRVWANPRAIVSWMTQCNRVDMTRRSNSYELRLDKYRQRGFEIYVPGLRREDVNPKIYRTPLVQTRGLARLLLLEHLASPMGKKAYIAALRKRHYKQNPAYRKLVVRMKYARRKGDLKARVHGMEMNDYDTAFHVPYGPEFNVKKIQEAISRADGNLNSSKQEQYLHRHPAFYGTMRQCIDGTCHRCPVPRTDEERELQEKWDDHFVRGRVEFIKLDAGRQLITGSFKPIDVDSWAEQAYAVTESDATPPGSEKGRSTASLNRQKDEVQEEKREVQEKGPSTSLWRRLLRRLTCAGPVDD